MAAWLSVRLLPIVSLGFLFVLAGCTTCSRSAGGPFVIGQDNFAFTNELMWTYEFAEDGSVTAQQVEPPPEFPHRCFPLVRAVREFFYHARFDPALPKATTNEYRQLVKAVVDRNGRCPSDPAERIIFPGYANLHTFSSDYSALIRHECGGSWRSYLQRGNWRMIFPISDRRERKTARALFDEIQQGRLPIIHIHRFPDVSLNHAILIYAAEKRDPGFIFAAYDPNNPGRPAALRFDSGANTFQFERNQYFGGGTVKVYEVYRGWFY